MWNPVVFRGLMRMERFILLNLSQIWSGLKECEGIGVVGAVLGLDFEAIVVKRRRGEWEIASRSFGLV